ncbi:MAG: DUF2156 domain-containing protein [Clostridia bacterium]|nr:DUF2156 domain-containing protein [Clostridia bacterium]
MIQSLNFHRLSLDDKAWVDAVFQGTAYRGCFCSFATFYLWKDAYHSEATYFSNALLARGIDREGQRYYMYPLGREYDIRACIEALREDAAAEGCPLRLSCVEEWQCEELRNAFPGEFTFELSRDDFDYMYRTEDLIRLSGKKYHAKRSHISQFVRAYPDWQYDDITSGNASECIAFADEWLAGTVAAESDPRQAQELRVENAAIVLALSEFERLGFMGGLLRVGGKIIAMTIGEPLQPKVFKVFVTHFEKADTGYNGAYGMINQQFALHGLAPYEYVNREEDMGREGLRKAKLSYHPAFLLEKYNVRDISFSKEA